MKSDDHDHDGGNGITRIKVPTVIITLDPATHFVALTCDELPISVAQMMLDEALRQLDIQRRQAAAIELQKQIAEAKRTAELVQGLNFKR